MESYLREALRDPEGRMVVGDHGPFWEGRDTLPGLSYSNTDGWGVVVFSRAFALGVDVEKTNRLLRKNHFKIAERYFHSSEVEWLRQVPVLDSFPAFLDLWMKKEAASKLMKVGLAEMIADPLPASFEFQQIAKTRVGYQAIVALAQPVRN